MLSHESVTISSPIPKGVEAIHVSIFDEKTMSSDEEIAFGLVTFPPEIFKGNVVDNWYPLSGRQGENLEGHINIVLSIKVMAVYFRNQSLL